MKYRDLKLSFIISNITFDVLSLSHEKIIKPYPRHAHSKNSYELHFVPQGSGTLVIDTQKYDITPGTIFMTGPEVPHEQISIRDNPMIEYSIYMQVRQPLPKQIPPLVQGFLECSFWFGHAEQSIYTLTNQLFEELQLQAPGYELMLQTISEKAYLIIEEAFLYDYKTITLTELANRVSLGVRQTERLLQKHYGQSFIKKKTEARMSAASQLLRETQNSIAEISEELGYSSPEHFSNAFTKYYKISPKKYRYR